MTKCPLRLTTVEKESDFFFFTHITRCCSPPFAPDYTEEKRGAVLKSVTPASKSYTDLYYYANSGCHGVFAKKPGKGRNISAGGLTEV